VGRCKGEVKTGEESGREGAEREVGKENNELKHRKGGNLKGVRIGIRK
jgi:hypothetical protein